MNKKVRIMLRILLGVILAMTFLSGLLMIPPIQSYLGRSLAQCISENIAQEIEINKISVSPFGRVELEDILIKDHHGDTMLYVPNTHARANVLSLLFDRTIIRNVGLDSPQIRIKHYTGEDKDNLSVFLELFKSDKKKDAPNIDINWAFIDNATISYTDQRKEDSPKTILHDFYLSVEDISISSEGEYSFKVSEITSLSNTGSELENLSASVDISSHGILIDDISLKTSRSTLKGDISVSPTKDSTLSMAENIRNGQIDLNISKCDIDPADIGFFYPPAINMPNIHMLINASYHQGLLSIRRAKFNSADIFSFTGHGDLLIDSTISDRQSKLVLSEIRIDSPSLLYYYDRLDIKKLSQSDIKKLKSLSSIQGDAVIISSKKLAKATMTLHTDCGGIFLDAKIHNPWNKHRAEYDVVASMDNVDLGMIIGNPKIGKINLYSQINGSGYTLSTANAAMRTYISSLELNGYEYNDLQIGSKIQDRTISSAMRISDTHLKASATDILSIEKDGQYHNKLNMYLDHASLSEIGLVKDTLVTLRASIESEISASEIDDATGHITLSEVSYNNANKYYYLDRVSITSTADTDSTRTLSLHADQICEGNISGRFRTSEIAATFSNAVMKRFNIYTPRPVTEGQDYTFELDVTASNAKILNTPLMFDGTTHLSGHITSDEGAKIRLIAQRINYQNVLIDTLDLDIDTQAERILSFSAEKMINPLYSIQDFIMTTTAHNDTLYTDADFRKWNDEKNVTFDIHSFYHEDSLKKITVGILPSEIHLESTHWNVGSDGKNNDRIIWNTQNGEVEIDSLLLYSQDSYVLAHGYYDSPENMDMRIGIRNIDLSRSVLVRKTHPLEGIINGQLRLSRHEDNSTIVPSVVLSIDGLGIDKAHVGDIRVGVKADLGERYISTFATLENQGRRRLNLTGGIHLDDKKLTPDISLTLDSLDIAVVHYLLPTVFNKSSGTLSAQLDMKDGNLTVPDINGHVTLNDANLGIAFTNVEYAVKRGSVVPVNHSFFDFKNVTFTDVKNGSRASLSGQISHDNFRTWYLDLSINADNALVLNTTEKNNEKFYGTVFATGSFHLHGPTHTLIYDIKGRAEKGSLFCIDVGSTSDFKLSEMIEFVPPKASHIDSLLQNIKKKIVREKIEATNEMNIQVEVDPNTLLHIYLDKSIGHMLEGRGNGMMYMNLSPKGTFSIDGSYEIVSGTYNFVYEMLFKRKFTITPGGRLTFDKDPANPMIDFSATYKNSTKPYSYLNSVSESTREEVLMTIYLSGYLNRPIYTFNIEMPKAPENVREELAYKLSDQEQLNQQFISLMVFNSFTNTGGENQNPNMVATGVTGLATSMLSNQFSNIVQHFVSGVDIDVNLNTSTNKITGTPTNTDFEVAISKKLFNDKVTVNGVVGVPTGSSQSNLVGDVEVEYNISSDGRFRGIFVNRRQEDYLNNQQGYIQSVGVSYRQEFDSFRDLGRLMKESFRRKSKTTATPSDTLLTPSADSTLLAPSIATDSLGQKNTVTQQSNGAYIQFL